MSISTLGIIGSGQLGSLLCQAAKKLDVKTVVISDDKDGPAQNYSDEFIYSKYDNKDKIKEFLSKVDIITYEFENIPIDILKEVNNEKKAIYFLFALDPSTFMSSFNEFFTSKNISAKKINNKTTFDISNDCRFN